MLRGRSLLPENRGVARVLRRIAAALALSLALLVGPAAATWSIVVVDTRTREVGVASATCVAGDLRVWVPIVRVGQGAAAAQSVPDTGAKNRRLIRKGFLRGARPSVVLHALRAFDSIHEQRQYGIVDLQHDPLTFSGTQTGNHSSGVAGTVGDLRYAIQGNLLTGAPVVVEAERALIETEGDLSQKLMAAMEAARAHGGDGRCSCTPLSPTSCGSPPASFGLSSLDAFLMVSREGDANGVCSGLQGCAAGNYYLNLHAAAGQPPGDPVRQLQTLYDAWRAGQVGRADHLNTSLFLDRPVLAADGADRAHVFVRLRDIEGDPAPLSGAQLLVQTVGSTTPVATVGPIQDEGVGRYSFDLVAGTQPGRNEWRVVVIDDVGSVVLGRTFHVAVVGPR